jgi:hypothetical protein
VIFHVDQSRMPRWLRFHQRRRDAMIAGLFFRPGNGAYISPMTKLAALLAALTVTVLCGLLALYAARLSVLTFLHWEAWVAVSLLFYASVFVLALRRKRQAERQAAKDEPLTPVTRQPLREL